MKISKIIFVLVLGFIACVPSAMALKRAPFPDSSSLQPIPADVQPNISGNVNSSVGVDQPSAFEHVLPNSETESNFNVPLTQENLNQNTGDSYGAYGIVTTIIIIVCVGVFVWRKLKNKK